ncbi:Sugar transporter ERD6-like 8 [Hibiscus syriacus]|uniref:Sugar transporter ERD6-like 8 n=1 Tax=Hibiscus syriacus TaxID=106335 RepID=A0A6A2YHK6_HIBSY|nr:Sugar transporter ERD6-like 8 [Hibiscus syriacus]
MSRQKIEDGELSSSLIVKEKPPDGAGHGSSGEEQGGIGTTTSATTMVVLSTIIAVCGSYVFGTAIGYSSPAQTGIIVDLGLSVAEVGVGLMVLQQFGGVNVIAFYASSIFISAGFSGSVGMIAMVFLQVPMTALGVVFLDKSGRRPLLLVSAAGTCLGCFLVGLSFFLQDLQQWKEATPILSLVGVLVYTGSFSLGMEGIPWVILSEIILP